MKKQSVRAEQTPDRTPLTQSQAKRLAGLSKLNASDLVGLTVAEISDKFRWQIEPEWLFFRRICGRVVKEDPNTHVQYPVPFATVYVEDTDCTFLGLFPRELPWAWFFPFFCYREVIGQTTTDECGNFCVWVPRFDIDWILQFRHERICFRELFVKPTVAQVIHQLVGTPIPRGPHPPDPGPLALRPGSALFQKAEQLLGTDLTRRLAVLARESTLGASNQEQQALLNRPAFPFQVPPPLPKEFRQPIGVNRHEHHKAVAETLAGRLGVASKQVEGLNLSRYCGPFVRCFDVVVPEWVPFFDVPDIGFRVTQDVNGNGVQEVIYSDGLFDVNWTGSLSDVTLVASPIAVSTRNCLAPAVPCGDVPSIEFVGLMPLVNPAPPVDPYVDGEGYATRPNRPHPSGLISDGLPHPLSQAPFTDTLQLYGCSELGDAAFYRLTYSFNGGSTTPFLGLTWPLYREVAGTLETLWPAADGQGWYPVLPAADGWFPNQLLLEWDTTQVSNGTYTIQLETTDATKTAITGSAPIELTVDNTNPIVQINNFLWRTTGAFQPLPTDDCAVIVRGNPPSDVEVQISFTVTAAHLRSVQLSSGGCNGGALLTSPTATAQHWYESAGDNSYTNTATFVIPASYPQGAYTFDLYATARAFNPSGGDGGHLADWNYDVVYRWTNPSFAIAVVNV